MAEPLPILVEGDPRLARVAEPVGAAASDLREAATRLVATLVAFRDRHGFGRAMAAPQVGIDKRMIAMHLGADPFVLLDPTITERSEETFEVWDDCLSVPGRIVRVKRHRSISIEYTDLSLRRRTWSRLPPDMAELVQHEIDHLDGILMPARAIGPDASQPIARWAELAGAARPRHRLSLSLIKEGGRVIDPIFTASPQFEAEDLSAELGARLTLKVETMNPLRCFKGRGAEHFLARTPDLRPMVCGSAGNFGQALAYACRRRGVALTVFVSDRASAPKVARIRALGADVRVSGADFDAAKDAGRRWAEESGAVWVEDGREPAISEGAGTIAVELLARDDAFDAVLVPLGNGALIGGVGRWIKAASPATRVIGVSASAAPAMERSWRNGPGGATVETTSADTIADGVAVRVPVPEAVADMHGLVDDVILVGDDAALDAMRLLHRCAGLVVEPSGALGVAAVRSAPERFAGKRIATILTGSNVTEELLASL